MTVSFTPNIGLAKPTPDEIARLWEASDIAKDNNAAFELAIPEDLSYNPQFYFGGTAGDEGINGNLRYGRRIVLPGDFVIGWFVNIFGSSFISTPAGNMISELPFDIDETFHNVGSTDNTIAGDNDVVGQGFLRNANNVATSIIFALDLVIQDGIHAVRPCTESFTGKTQRFITNSEPFTFESGDSITGSYFYKAVIP